MLSFRKCLVVIRKDGWLYSAGMKRYDQYCPVARAVQVVGERWTLLVVRELATGPKRYTDLAAGLPGIGTNVLAGRLRDLEAEGVIEKHRLPPPAASQVYELTQRGLALLPVLRSLAHWGAVALGPPPPDVELEPGWLHGALRTSAWGVESSGSVVFRIGDEVASLVDGEAVDGAADDPDAVVAADAEGFYHLFVHRRFDGVSIDGDRGVVERVLDAIWPVAVPVAV
jgi:DNA-binding HxlR family transcriptional regulator